MNKIILILLVSIIYSHSNTSAQYIISTPVSVSDMDDSYGRKSPKLAINANGELLVFWMRTGSNEAFFISTLTSAGFTTPTQIPFGGLNPDLWSGSLGPNMASNGDDVFVCFEVYGDAIYIVHSEDGGSTWGDPVAAFIPPAGRRATIPIIAVDDESNPYVAYVNTNISEGDAYYGMVRSTDQGQTFLDEVDVSIESAGDEVCECCNGHIDIASNGDVYVTFRNNDNNQRDIWMARSTDGGSTFSSAYDIDETDWTISACPTNGPHFAIVNNELVAAFYSGVGDDGSGVYYSRFTFLDSVVSSTISLPLAELESSNQNRPKVAGSGDTLAIVWEESYSGSKEIVMSISTDGYSGLDESSFMLTDMESTQQLSNVVYNNERFHVVYEDSQSGTVMYQEVSFGVVGIAEKNENSFTFGPNPCNSELSILRQSADEETLKIIDLHGRVVYQETLKGTISKINVSNLISGMYLIIIGDNSETMQKLLVQ